MREPVPVADGDRVRGIHLVDVVGEVSVRDRQPFLDLRAVPINELIALRGPASRQSAGLTQAARHVERLEDLTATEFSNPAACPTAQAWPAGETVIHSLYMSALELDAIDRYLDAMKGRAASSFQMVIRVASGRC